jgi:hypothetical protein
MLARAVFVAAAGLVFFWIALRNFGSPVVFRVCRNCGGKGCSECGHGGASGGDDKLLNPKFQVVSGKAYVDF